MTLGKQSAKHAKIARKGKGEVVCIPSGSSGVARPSRRRVFAPSRCKFISPKFIWRRDAARTRRRGRPRYIENPPERPERPDNEQSLSLFASFGVVRGLLSQCQWGPNLPKQFGLAVCFIHRQISRLVRSANFSLLTWPEQMKPRPQPDGP